MQRITHKRMFVLFAFVAALELLASIVSAADDNLEYVHAGQDAAWYITARATVPPGVDKAAFWSKVVPEKNGAYYDVLKMALEKRGKDPVRLEYIRLLQDADCSLWKISTADVLFYDNEDRIVLEVKARGPAQLIAEFGRAEDDLLTAVCSQQMASLTTE